MIKSNQPKNGVSLGENLLSLISYTVIMNQGTTSKML